jgi:hypothetical protein
MGYIRNHWLGRHSLIWSFSINLVLLRLIIFYLDRFTHPPFLEHPTAVAAATVSFLVVGHLVIYPWQIVGMLRSCERYLRDFGSAAWVWAVYLGIVVSIVVTLISAFGALQWLLIDRDAELAADVLARERAAKYALSHRDGDTLIRLSGSLEMGVTKKLKAILRQHPEITGMVLESDGGNIYESRGIAKLIQEYGLDTYVFASCSSACTTAFIGGTARILGENGRLGFHQYGLSANLPLPFLDIEKEQEKDRRFYRNQKIDEAFLERVFDASHAEIWFPSTEVLLAAGVVHRVEGFPR